MNQNHYKLEFFIWPTIPILFFILYLFKLYELREGQAIVCLTILLIVLLTLYFYLYQSKSSLLRILLGLSSAIILGPILKIFHIKGATLILMIGSVVDIFAKPTVIGLILKRYKSEITEIKVLLISIMILQIVTTISSILGPYLSYNDKHFILLTSLTLVSLTTKIVLHRNFLQMNEFIQNGIKSILLFN